MAIGPHLMVVTPYFYPRIGGAEKYAYHVARRLHDGGDYRVSVMTTNPDTGRYRREVRDGLTMHHLPAWFRLSNTPMNPLWYWRCAQIFAEEGPDILHLHAPVPFLADVAARAAPRVPLVLTYHAGSMVKGRGLADPLIRLYESTLLPVLFRRVDTLVLGDPGFIEQRFPQFSGKMVVIAPGVDLEQFVSSPLPDPLYTVTYVGRIEHHSDWKGIEPLLQAMALVRKAQPRARLELVGGGDAVTHYTARAASLGIAEAVQFCGPQSGAELAASYRRAGMVVLPSTSPAESFGMVLLEAMASRRPVIGSRVGGIPRLIAHEENGLLVSPGDPHALAAAILRLLSERATAQRLAEAGAATARQYSWDLQVQKYRALFASLLSAGAR